MVPLLSIFFSSLFFPEKDRSYGFGGLSCFLVPVDEWSLSEVSHVLALAVGKTSKMDGSQWIFMISLVLCLSSAMLPGIWSYDRVVLFPFPVLSPYYIPSPLS